MTPPTVMHWPAAVGGGGAWTPANLASLTGWFDDTSWSGASNGAVVTSWTNNVSGGLDLPQSAASLQPTVATNVLNSKPVMNLDGTEYLTQSSWDNSTTSAYTAMFVFRFIGTQPQSTAGVAFFGSGTISGIVAFNTPGFAFALLPNNNFSGSAYDSGVGSTQLVDGDWAIISTTRTNALGGFTDIYLDGALQSQNTLTGSLTLSDGFTLGAWPTTRNLKGQIAEVIYTDTELSSSDRQKSEGYLAHTWGLTSKLPLSHPYKSTAP